jgi:hypothetical protein
VKNLFVLGVKKVVFPERSINAFASMTRRRQSTTAKIVPQEDKPQLSLLVGTSRERLRVLLKERERLIREVQKKKLELEQAGAEVKQSSLAMLEKLAPIVDRHHALCLELNQIFDELLAPGRLSESARKKVAKVRRILEDDGILTKLDNGPDGDGEYAEEHHGNPFGAAPEQPFDHSVRENPSATPRGQGAGHESLRALFKRLALTLHPDRASQEADRERRTEAMKQVTQAYNDGDLARLLELEKAWEQSDTLDSGRDDESRCLEIERIIHELRAQATTLDRERRDMKKRASFAMVSSYIKVMVKHAQAELDEYETVCEFVKSFRDGKITLTQFVRGPEFTFANDEY